MNAKPRYYRDQQAWKDLQALLPARLHLTDAGVPQEEFWTYRGHAIHLDRYANPHAPAKVILHHGVGTNGRQMSMILGAPLARLELNIVLPILFKRLPGLRMAKVPEVKDVYHFHGLERLDLAW